MALIVRSAATKKERRKHFFLGACSYTQCDQPYKMSEQDPFVMIPTAMQQRLQWKPVKGAAFRRLTHFVALLEVYYFATGKRYERKPVKDPRTHFVCDRCEKGRVGLRIHRKNAKAYWWVVQTVTTCNCGSPPELLEDLQLHGPIALEWGARWKKSGTGNCWRMPAFPMGTFANCYRRAPGTFAAKGSKKQPIRCIQPVCCRSGWLSPLKSLLQST